MSTIADLIAHWKRQGMLVSLGNNDRALATFEAHNGVRLPSDLRQYFSAINGMLSLAGSDCDEEGFRFWPLSDVKPVPLVCAATGVSPPDGANMDKCFIFADYREWSWAYAIDLSGSPEGDHPVIHVGTLQPKTVARSFSQFVDLYLRDSLDVYVSADKDL